MTDRATLADCRTVQVCWKNGVVPFCERNGLDHRKLAREGLTFEELQKVDDFHVHQLIAAAKKRIYG
jgi:hypothetical protein